MAVMPPSPEPTLLARLGRGLLFLAGVCTVIAVFLTVLDGQPGAKFIYSFAIGGCCWLIIDATRLLLSHWLRRRQRLTGTAPPGPRTFELGWGGMLPLLLREFTQFQQRETRHGVLVGSAEQHGTLKRGYRFG